MPAIAVQLLGDSRSLERAFIRGGAAASTFNKRMIEANEVSRGALSQFGGKTSFLFGSNAFIGAAVATGVLVKTTKAAQDLQKQIERTDLVFGKSSDDIKAWSESTANSIGIAQSTALQAAGSFGTLFHAIGLTPPVADQMSKRLVQLGADLGALNNTDPGVALNALRQALLGNTRGLKQFNVIVNTTQVNQRALADTGKKTASSLTNQEKVLARYEIILNQTAIATGAFSAHSQDAAQQAQILKANLSDLEEQIGTKVLPTFTLLVQDTNLLFEGFQKLQGLKLPPVLKQLQQAGSGSKGGLLGKIFVQTPLGSLIHPLDSLNGKLALLKLGLKAVGLGGQEAASGIAPAVAKFSELRDVGARSSIAVDALTASLQGFKAAAHDVAGLDFKALQAEADQKPLRDRIALQKQIIAADKKEVAAAQSGSRAKTQAVQKQIADQNQLGALQGQVTSANADAARKVQAAAEKRNQAEQDAIQKSFQKFDVKLSKAQLTPDFGDDLAILVKELAVVRDLESKHKGDLDLQQKELDIRGQIVDLQKQQADQTKQQLDEARSQAQQLFGNLFQAPDLTAAAPTFLGGSRGRKIVPGTGGSASDLLANITSQNKAFAVLTQNIATLAKRGAPASLLQAARSGQLTAAQVSALAHAQSSVLNKIFAQTRRADKLITKVAKAEINANQATVNIGKLQTAGVGTDRGSSHEQPLKIQVYLDGKKIEESLERRAKKRAPQRRGRTGGKR